jgi:DNA polymerase III sliding clamp (beta) subunit (PCNA family)
MRFTTTCGILRDALTAARSACSPGAPVLAHTGVRLRVAAGQVDVCGSDSDVSVLAEVVGAVDTLDGEVVLTPGPLGSLLDASSASDVVTLSVESGDVVVAVDDQQPYTLRGLDVQFPPPLTVTSEPRPVDGERLGEALAAVKPASTSVIPGVSVRSNATGLRVAATDSYRLHVATVDGSAFGDFEGVVPLAVLDRAVRAKVDHVAVDPGGRLISFRGRHTSVTARLLQPATPYPSIDSMLAAPSTVRLHVDRQRWVAALSRLAAVGSDVPVTLRAADGLLTLAARQTEVGDGEETIAVEVASGDVEAIEFAADRGFLAAAGSVHAGRLTLSWQANDKPLYVSSTGTVDVTTVISPVLFH